MIRIKERMKKSHLSTQDFFLKKSLFHELHSSRKFSVHLQSEIYCWELQCSNVMWWRSPPNDEIKKKKIFIF